MVDLSLALTEDIAAKHFDLLSSYLNEAEKRTGLKFSDFIITATIERQHERFTLAMALDSKKTRNPDEHTDRLRFTITVIRKGD